MELPFETDSLFKFTYRLNRETTKWGSRSHCRLPSATPRFELRAICILSIGNMPRTALRINSRSLTCKHRGVYYNEFDTSNNGIDGLVWSGLRSDAAPPADASDLCWVGNVMSGYQGANLHRFDLRSFD